MVDHPLRERFPPTVDVPQPFEGFDGPNAWWRAGYDPHAPYRESNEGDAAYTLQPDISRALETCRTLLESDGLAEPLM